MKLIIWKAKDGWRWHVKARNGKIIAESGESYKRRATMLNTIQKLASCLWDGVEIEDRKDWEELGK